MSSNVTIFDANADIISTEKQGQVFLVDSRYAVTIPHDDGIMIAEASKGCYTAPGTFFVRAPADEVYPYQLLVPRPAAEDAIMIDRLNPNFVILSAVIDGICVGSQAFEQSYQDGDLKRFCSRYNISPDAQQVEIQEYLKPRKLQPFQESGDRLQTLRKKRKESMILFIAAMAAICGLALFGADYTEHVNLMEEMEDIKKDMAALTANIPQGDLQTIEKLQKDEVVVSYLKDLSALEPSALVSITPDGAVFKSRKSLRELKQLNPRVTPIQTDNFFLPVSIGSKLPGDK